MINAVMSMEQSPFEKPAVTQLVKKIPCFLWNSDFHYYAQIVTWPSSEPSESNPHTFYSFNTELVQTMYMV
jgi:hypothetical protein